MRAGLGIVRQGEYEEMTKAGNGYLGLNIENWRKIKLSRNLENDTFEH